MCQQGLQQLCVLLRGDVAACEQQSTCLVHGSAMRRLSVLAARDVDAWLLSSVCYNSG